MRTITHNSTIIFDWFINENGCFLHQTFLFRIFLASFFLNSRFRWRWNGHFVYSQRCLVCIFYTTQCIMFSTQPQFIPTGIELYELKNGFVWYAFRCRNYSVKVKILNLYIKRLQLSQNQSSHSWGKYTNPLLMPLRANSTSSENYTNRKYNKKYYCGSLTHII